MKPVLLLVDLQNDFLTTPELQPNVRQLVNGAAVLLNACRERRIPIVHVWTTVSRETDRRLPHWRAEDRWMCLAGTEGHSTPSALSPLKGEGIIHKSGFNAFAGGTLEARLRELNCDALIVSGVHLHACVRAVAAEGLERQFKVFVAEDAVGSNDPVHAAAVRRWLAERTVEFGSVASILNRIDGGKPGLQHCSPRLSHQVLFEIPVDARKEVALAVGAANDGWKEWRKTSQTNRVAVLERLIELLEETAPDLALQMALEIGKPVIHAREEIRRTADNIRDVIQRAVKLRAINETAVFPRHQPHGVVAIVSPWNNPAAIPLGKIAPALIHGNTVVWKPAPAATCISEFLLGLLRQAGVPGNAVRLLTGDHSTAQQLAAEPEVQAVTFTGSLAGGHAMQEICARRMIPLQAELSGNNAAIIWDDADLASAAAQVAWGAFAFAGQRCTANRRVIVSEALFDRFMPELKRAAERLVWGDPMDEKTDLGPVISSSKRNEIAALIDFAQQSGVVHRVERLHPTLIGQEWIRAGAYIQPTLLCCDRPESEIVQEESMAPLLVVQRARDFDHALELCDGVRHGLIAALFSRDPDLQRKFLAEARAGILKLNASTTGVDVRLPFGGWKASGLGPPEHGAGDVIFYTRMQALYGVEKLPEIQG
jgi:acyl-CoA reductase-like NAD-dependent aldehyde dehydrogenase/nicotinamidase-related amidase